MPTPANPKAIRDLTIDTGWAKLRYLEHILSEAELESIRWRNASRIFPPSAFPAD